MKIIVKDSVNLGYDEFPPRFQVFSNSFVLDCNSLLTIQKLLSVYFSHSLDSVP